MSKTRFWSEVSKILIFNTCERPMRVVIEYEIGYMACFIVYPRPLERPNVLGDVLSSGEGRKGLMGRKLS